MPANVLQLSDVHFRAGGAAVGDRDPRERLDRVLTAVRQRAVAIDALLLTGDLTDDGSRSACEDLAGTLAPLGLPTLAVPGNHDDPRAVRDVFGPDLLDIGGWRIVGIDTSRPRQIHGTVDTAAEAARLDRLDRKWTILAMHHPPVSLTANPWFQLDGAAEFATAIGQRPHVRAVLAGHLHHPYEARAGGAIVLGGPSTLVSFDHTGDDLVIGVAETTGARICSLHDDGTLTGTLIRA
jgi:Icc protein